MKGDLLQLFCAVVLISCGCVAGSSSSYFNNSSLPFKPQLIDTYNNPILDYVSPDPQALHLNGFYYMVLSDNQQITVLKSSILTDFRGAQNKVVFRAPQGMSNIRAPEIHFLQGNIYIYFAMEKDNKESRRMYVIKANDSNNPIGGWSEEKRLLTEDPVDYWMTDGTPLEHGDGQLYFLWSGWPDVSLGSPQNLYIARMCDPETICGNRVLLREPKYDWEGPFTLEGPYALKRKNRTFIVFSAGSTFSPDYCLGIMGLGNLDNPLDLNAWWHKIDGCVFYRNDPENVFCTGHAAFTTSPDGSETWMLFHATDDVKDPGSRRVARVEKILWDENDFPVFPRPSGDSSSLHVPSGQIQETFANPILDEISADPGIFRIGERYYLTASRRTEHELVVYRSDYLTDFRGATNRVIYSAPEGYHSLWASELQLIRGQLYIYFTMYRIGGNHYQYVIKADDPNDPLGNWSKETRLMPDNEEYTVDGTVLQYGNGTLYYIYANAAQPVQLFITEMVDPMNVPNPGIALRTPKSGWECGRNHGPSVVQNEGRTFLIFSVCGAWSPDSCLSMIGIDDLRDPMVPSNWWNDLDRCLFYRNDVEGVYTTGQATFTTSPDGTELWMIYHATNDEHSNGSSIRTARAQKINWNQDKSPAFPRPSGYGHQVAVPSGQKSRMSK